MTSLKMRATDDEQSVSSDSASVSTGAGGDNSSKFGDGSTSAGGTANEKSSNNDMAAALRARMSSEEKLVNRARIFTAVSIVVSAIAVSTAVYFFSTQSDYKSFEIGYEGHSNNMLAMFKWEVQYNFGTFIHSVVVVFLSVWWAHTSENYWHSGPPSG